MSTYVLQIIAAFVGSFGFAMLFNVRKSLILSASAGGILCWVVYLLCEHFGFGVFVSSLLTAMVVSLYAQIFARIRKTPSTIFFVSSIIPLIPGSSLFYTMYNAVSGEAELFAAHGINTLLCACGIAAGTAFVYAVFIIFTNFSKRKTGAEN